MNKKLALLIATIFFADIGVIACADETKPLYIAKDYGTSGDAEFDAWRKSFSEKAVNVNGKDPSIIESMFDGVTPNITVTNLNNSQPETIKPVWSYINSAVNANRIKIGIEQYPIYKDKLSEISNSTGVPTEVVIAIWGMESAYGAVKGDIDAVRALSTLGYKGRRTALGESELLYIADMLKNGDITREGLRGSWAGAMGHTQFMPSSYINRAIDGDNDGKKDIWNNPIDALASSMNFLKIAGWKANEPWGRLVEVKPDFDYSLADGTYRQISFWRANGIISQNSDFPSDWNVRLLVPAGANGPKFLVGVNFAAIRNYNASDSYALSVALLSDEIKGQSQMPNNWPINDPPLKRNDAIEMQTILTRMGFDIGTIDGAPGAKTKAALQAFQKSRGLVADGYPSIAALNSLRDAIGIAPPQNPQTTPIVYPDPKPEIAKPTAQNADGMPVKMFEAKKN